MDYYYISTGDKTKMYTLRHAYTEQRHTREGVMDIRRDEYCCNLSIDWGKAMAKAQARVGGGTLRSEEFNLEEIRRRNAEEVEAARIQKQECEDAQRASRVEAHLAEVQHCIFPFGKYTGKTFDDVYEYDRSYIQYMGSIKIEEADPVPELLKKVLQARYPELFVPLPEANGEYYGEVGSRETFNAMITARFGFETQFGWTTVLKMVKDSGELLVYMGSGNVDGDKGDAVQFTATIKEHALYDGENQTKVQRPAKWAVIED